MVISGLGFDLLLFALLLICLLLLFRAHSDSGAGGPGQGLGDRLRNYYPTLSRQAGFNPGRFSWVYWLAKIILMAALPLMVVELWLISWVSVFILAIVGFLVPDLWLANVRKRRRRRIRSALSYFLDLLVALLHSGLILEDAFRRAGRGGLQRSHPKQIEKNPCCSNRSEGKLGHQRPKEHIDQHPQQ